MRPWVVWCINHKLKWFVLALWALSFPLYMGLHWGDFWRSVMKSWKGDGDALFDA